MSLRIRKNGEILCGAMSLPEEDDLYIDDRIHYYLFVLTDSIIPCENHLKTGLWFWNIKSEFKKHYEEITTH